MFLSPLYIYLFGGILAGWFGNNLVSTDAPISWNPREHHEAMLMCRKTCDGKVAKYEPTTGDCTCQKAK